MKTDIFGFIIKSRDCNNVKRPGICRSLPSLRYASFRACMKRIVRAAGGYARDRSREDCHAVYGIQFLHSYPYMVQPALQKTPALRKTKGAHQELSNHN
ncbi:MAG TPA: hypothetical protein DEB39_12205 [Planctomycetaceae bacterium]|nr:hypothetical protein [Planctomycetaceae bacterium]